MRSQDRVGNPALLSPAIATLLPFLRPASFYDLDPLRIDTVDTRFSADREAITIGGIDGKGSVFVGHSTQRAALDDTLSDDTISIVDCDHIA